MARKQAKPRGEFKIPAGMTPDYQAWGSTAEERKWARLSAWLRETDQADRYFFEWVPAYLEERRRLAGLPPSPPSRRRGPLPASVRRQLERIDQGNQAPMVGVDDNEEVSDEE